MKALLEDVEGKKGNQSFLAYSFTLPSFEFKWHFHPEYELTLITRGSGKRLVGDSYQNYETGDLVLLGPDLPHTWVSNPSKKAKYVSAVVIQFSGAFIQAFLKLPEFKEIALMLSSAPYGLAFSSLELLSQLWSFLTKRVLKRWQPSCLSCSSSQPKNQRNWRPAIFVRSVALKTRSGLTSSVNTYKSMRRKSLV